MFNTTVDSILSDFTKKITLLDALITKGQDRHVRLASEVDVIRGQIADNDTEIKRAGVVRAKIAELVG